MIKDALEYLVGLAKPETFNFDGKRYATDKLVELPSKKPTPARVELHTLTGLLAFIQYEQLGKPLVTVDGPNSVTVRSGFVGGEFLQRFEYVRATPYLPGQSISNAHGWQDLETFLLMLQTWFVQDETTELLLQLLGNMKTESVATIADDGISQSVATRRGVSSLEKVVLPSPLLLRPFRTFSEIEQPASSFVLRIRGDEDGADCRLVETHDNQWQLKACADIEEYLVAQAPDLVVVS